MVLSYQHQCAAHDQDQPSGVECKRRVSRASSVAVGLVGRCHGNSVPGRDAITGELQLIRPGDVVRVIEQPLRLWHDRISAVKAAAARDGKVESSSQHCWG